jgi:hypothetical protein
VVTELRTRADGKRWRVAARLIIHRPNWSRGPKVMGILVDDVHQGDLERGETLECDVPAGEVSITGVDRGVPRGSRSIVTREGQRVEVHVLHMERGKWAIAPMATDPSERPSEDRLLQLGQAMTTVWSPPT